MEATVAESISSGSQTRKRHDSRIPIAAGCIVWLISIAWVYGFLLRYEALSGVTLTRAPKWPEQSRLKLIPGFFTLVMFVHPKCPCSQASLSELAVIMSRCRELRGYVVFIKPAGSGDDWERTALWQRAGAIPGVTAEVDERCREATRFGASVSGETLLYDPSGRLIFGGGVTASRGHEGDNLGVDVVEALVHGDKSALLKGRTPVYGCSLLDDSVPNREVFQLWKP